MISLKQAAIIAEEIFNRELAGYYSENSEAFLFSMKDAGPVSPSVYVDKKSGKGHMMFFDEYCDYIDAGKPEFSDAKPLPAN